MKLTKLPLALLVATSFAYAGFDVLLAATEEEGYQTDILTGLAGFSSDFDTVDWHNLDYSGELGLGDIQPYDCVVTWTAYPGTSTWGDTLADYVDSGGKVVVATFAFYNTYGLSGRIFDTGYCPFAVGSGNHYDNDDWELGSPDEPGHPFLENVSSLNCGYRDYPSLNAWGNLVTHYVSDSEEALAYNDDNTVAAINAYPGHVGFPEDWTGDYPQCLRNVIVDMCTVVSIRSASLGEIKAIYR